MRAAGIVAGMCLLFAVRGECAESSPAGIVHKLIAYADEGCQFLRRASHIPKSRRPTARTIASHFGTIVSEHRAGTYSRFVIASTAFPGWKVTLGIGAVGTVELYVPIETTLLVSDFETRLGKAEDPDIEYAALRNPRNNSTNVAPPSQLYDFRGTDAHPWCAMGIGTDGRDANRHQQRVTMFEFIH